MKGLMQEVGLTIPMILRRAATVGGDMAITSVGPSGTTRTTWREVSDRSLRLAAALDSLGVSPGAAVGSFAWNSHRHLELYYGVPCSGRVLHTTNVRLHPDDIAYVVGHAGDEALFVDASLTSVLAPVRDRLETKVFVVLDDGADTHPAFADDPRYEDLLASVEPAPPAPVDESDAASICFTSGTTGRPKAVVYSHRSIVLHSMGALMVDGHAVRRGDVVLPLTPMFHVNCWGLPYTSGLAPASLVFTGSDTSPASSARLIESERPTVLAGIPTFWIQMDHEFDGERDLSSVERILCGGAEAPPALISRYTQRGINFFHAWGMTEMSPSGTGTWIPAGDDGAGATAAKHGVSAPLVELRLMSDDGEELPWDGEAVGELQARGPWVARAYFDPDDDSNVEKFPDGWIRTGDVARISPEGRVEIVDRMKDLVKSGGEWISSVELERVLASHPAVRESAVVALPHERWGERPAALIVVRPGETTDADDIRAFLEDRVAKWWIPETIEFVDDLPKTGVGKVDKKLLRSVHVPRLIAALGEAAPE